MNKTILTLKQTWIRLKSKPANEYWVTIRKAAIKTGLVAGAIVTASTMGLTVPIWLVLGAKYAIAVTSTLTVAATATKKDIPTVEEALQIIKDAKDNIEDVH